MFAREHPMRPIWTTLLITAPRISAFAAVDVADLDHKKGRLLLRGNRRKRAGAGAVDEKTLKEIEVYLGDRSEGPLFLSPGGVRIRGDRSLHRWRAAASLAFVDLEWPDREPRDLRTAYLVHLALTRGRVRVAMGGAVAGPHAPGPEKSATRRKQAAAVGRIADAVRDRWQHRMRGIDHHCLRMTHRTWALATGVPEILIDRQLGHTTPSRDAMLRTAWSIVGRLHYTDMDFLSLDARRSAEAVRGILDEAEAALRREAGEETALLGHRKLASLMSTGEERVRDASIPCRAPHPARAGPLSFRSNLRPPDTKPDWRADLGPC